MDVVFVVLILVLFALAWGLVKVFEDL